MPGFHETRTAMGAEMDDREIPGDMLSATKSDFCWGRHCNGHAVSVQLHLLVESAIGGTASAGTSGWAQRSLH